MIAVAAHHTETAIRLTRSRIAVIACGVASAATNRVMAKPPP